MNNYDLQEQKIQISDPIDSYFECISTCDLIDHNCISRCIDKLKQNDG